MKLFTISFLRESIYNTKIYLRYIILLLEYNYLWFEYFHKETTSTKVGTIN